MIDGDQQTQRAITGFHPDDEGEWVAELECGHNQHVRHRPPFEVREWVTQTRSRESKLGTMLGCPLCDRTELPEGLILKRTTPIWTEETMPEGLRKAHKVAAGNWGNLMVHSGHVVFSADTRPPIKIEMEQGSNQPIPPGIEHEVAPIGPATFSVQFFAIDRQRPQQRPPERHPRAPGQTFSPAELSEEYPEGDGDMACWAGMLCPECGSVPAGGYHRTGCNWEAESKNLPRE